MCVHAMHNTFALEGLLYHNLGAHYVPTMLLNAVAAMTCGLQRPCVDLSLAVWRPELPGCTRWLKVFLEQQALFLLFGVCARVLLKGPHVRTLIQRCYKGTF